jgi:hypothetical protein
VPATTVADRLEARLAPGADTPAPPQPELAAADLVALSVPDAGARLQTADAGANDVGASVVPPVIVTGGQEALTGPSGIGSRLRRLAAFLLLATGLLALAGLAPPERRAVVSRAVDFVVRPRPVGPRTSTLLSRLRRRID